MKLDKASKSLINQELLLRFFDGHGHGDGCTDHGVVAHADQTHHFYVGGDGGRTGELSVTVHTTNSIVHTAVELLFLKDDAVLNIGQITYQYLQPKS